MSSAALRFGLSGRSQPGFQVGNHHRSRNTAAVALGRFDGSNAAPDELCLILALGYRGANRFLHELRQRFALLKYAFKFKPEVRGDTNRRECGCFHGFIVLQLLCKSRHSKHAAESPGQQGFFHPVNTSTGAPVGWPSLNGTKTTL